jgi:predicted nucleic acid-binding protein
VVTLAYVDTSVLVALMFSESGSSRIEKTIHKYSRCLSHHLIEAELRSVGAREGIGESEVTAYIAPLNLLYPTTEICDSVRTVLKEGYLRGADLLHVAAAHALSGAVGVPIAFLTLDRRQTDIARRVKLENPLENLVGE